MPEALRETRRILLDGYPVDVVRHGETLVAGDGREVAIVDALHLPPVDADARSSASTSTTICRVKEMMTELAACPDVLPQAGLRAQLPQRRGGAAGVAASGSTTRARSPS
ncbi:MAG: hypothetical protein V9F00_01990 [Nocardioides sp.]